MSPERADRSNPPLVPATRTVEVKTLEEALKIERPQEGSWVPSPSSRSGFATGWASPAPRKSKSTVSEDPDPAVDFDLVIDDGGDSHDVPNAKQPELDTDVPAKRVLSRQTSRFEMEQLFSPHSLPKPLSADRREDLIRTLLPTATYQMMAKVPRRLLDQADEQSQALRRRLARGATMVFFCAGLQGKRFTFERAAALGIKSVVIDHLDCWASSLVDEGIIAKFVPVDMRQTSEQVFDEALRQIKLLGQDGKTGPVDGITTFVELSVPIVARLCEAMGLPGHRPAAVDSARDKHATRAALKAAGLPYPRNCLIRCEADFDIGAREVGFPAVLKPVSGAASLGVRKVSSFQEMRTCYGEIVAEMKTLVVCSGALVKNDGNKDALQAEGMVDLTVLMEQYLDGSEVDVDIVMSDGEWRYAAVADNGPTLEPYFNETWAVCPSLLPKEQQVELKQLAVNCVKSLGFTSGVFHVECKYTSKGPQLIEVNARMGGGQIHETNMRTWGVDLCEETYFAALGIPSRPKVPKMPLSAVAYCYVNASKSGIVKDLRGMEGLRQRPGVVWAKPLVRQGAKATGPQDGLPTWLADLLVTRPTSKEALAFLKELEAEEPVKVEPN